MRFLEPHTYQKELNHLHAQQDGIEDFKSWIIRYRQRDSRRGDLAFDIYRDPNFPRGNNKDVMEHYMKHRLGGRTAREAIQVFHGAYRAYESYLRKNHDDKLLKQLEELQRQIESLQEQIKKSSLRD